jgi:hypothetical protein
MTDQPIREIAKFLEIYPFLHQLRTKRGNSRTGRPQVGEAVRAESASFAPRIGLAKCLQGTPGFRLKDPQGLPDTNVVIECFILLGRELAFTVLGRQLIHSRHVLRAGAHTQDRVRGVGGQQG